METWRFDKNWVEDQWKRYMDDKEGKDLSVIEFTSLCISKVKGFKNQTRL